LMNVGPTPGGSEIRIIDMRKAPSMVPARLGKNDVHFTYMIGSEGPFLITVPEEDLTGKVFDSQKDVVKRKILAEQEERTRWRGAPI